ncbi:MAG TPA: hypothetical protein VLL97_04665 [Acidobacteriota bacterium]|nr:hypothetical protein [Acidobacteriota bacterium]
MHLLIKPALMMTLLCAAAFSGYAQLRTHSPYHQDRINTDATRFTLHETDTAEFTWASEWTQETAQSFSDYSAIFLWHFKDGTKAYSRQGKYVGDFGRLTGYDPAESGSALTDGNLNATQPMTRNNYPVMLELWIGKAGESGRVDTQMLVDYVCFEGPGIEYGRPNYFSRCPAVTGKQ